MYSPDKTHHPFSQQTVVEQFRRGFFPLYIFSSTCHCSNWRQIALHIAICLWCPSFRALKKRSKKIALSRANYWIAKEEKAELRSYGVECNISTAQAPQRTIVQSRYWCFLPAHTSLMQRYEVTFLFQEWRMRNCWWFLIIMTGEGTKERKRENGKREKKGERNCAHTHTQKKK